MKSPAQLQRQTLTALQTASHCSTTQQPTCSNSNSDSKPSYKAALVVAFYKKLQKIYGRQFSAMFKTENDLLESQSEWSSHIARLTPEQISLGMEKLKEEKVNGNAMFDWPDIAKTIALCKGKGAKKVIAPEHRLFNASVVEELTNEQRQSRLTELKKLRAKITRQAIKRRDNPHLIDKV